MVTENDTAKSGSRVLLEVWVAVNEEGNYEVGTEEEEAAARLMETHGGYHCRIVKLVVFLNPPAPYETLIEVPNEIGHVVEVKTAID